MSVTAFDPAEHAMEVAPAAAAPASPRAASAAESAAVARSHRTVRRWTWWLAAPLAVLAAAGYWRLDLSFVAVGLLLGAMIIIRLVQAWSEYDLARREDAGATRPTRRRPRGAGR